MVNSTEELAIVPYRPYRRFVIFFIFLVVLCVTAAMSFFIGSYYSDGDYLGLIAERNRLMEDYALKLEEVRKYEAQMANLKLGSRVDRKATESIRSELVDLKQQIAELEKENQFYREIMSPSPEKKGIVIDTPVITATKEEGRYKYNVAVKQIATKHAQVTANLEFLLVGIKDNKEQKISLKQVSDTVESDSLKLRFKYFQRIEGEMTLPEGFEPLRIELKVVANKPKKAVIENKFGWISQEG